MTPFFAPRPHQFRIPIYIAGVNEHICRLAGELCDGLHAHPFNSPKYLREFVMPHLEEGFKKSGRARADYRARGNRRMAWTRRRLVAPQEWRLRMGRAVVLAVRLLRHLRLFVVGLRL